VTQALDPGFHLEDLTENQRTMLAPFRDPVRSWAVEARAEMLQLADPGTWPVDPIVWKHLQSLIGAQGLLVDAVERAHDECAWMVLDRNQQFVSSGKVAGVTTAVHAVWSVAKVFQAELRALAITTNLR
jgi:hypothetical protein